MLKNATTLAIVAVHTEENEPLKIGRCFRSTGTEVVAARRADAAEEEVVKTVPGYKIVNINICSIPH